MLSAMEKDLLLTYCPHFYRDQAEPIPILKLGCTVFETPGFSGSFRDLWLDPQALDAKYILEYAIYFDYDIQHLYDLEHVWVVVGREGQVVSVYSSYHGMRMCASGPKGLLKLDDTHPVLYLQPGKHAVLPDPELFKFHAQYYTCCRETAGGGLLIPPMLVGRLHTDAEQDARIRAWIRRNLSFTPTEVYVPAEVTPDQFVSLPELLDAIVAYVEAQLKIINA